MPTRLGDLAKEVAICVESVNRAIAKIANQHRIRELPEIGWRQSHSPGSVEHAPCRKSADELSIHVKDVNQTIARANDRVMLRPVLHRIGYKYLVVDELYSVRRVAGREVRVGERTRERGWIERKIKDVHLPAAEVRCQQKVARPIAQQREPFIDGAGGRVIHYLDGSDSLAPASQDAVFRVEDELCASEVSAQRIGHGSGRTSRITGIHRCCGYLHDEGILVAAGIVEC